MIIIAIDPSPTHTAIVSIDSARPDIIFDGVTLTAIDAAAWLSDRLLQHRAAPTHVIIEKPPSSPKGMNEASSQTIGAYWMLRWITERHGVGLTTIMPGSWKPAAKGWQIPFPPSLEDKHQRDAYSMIAVAMKGKLGHVLAAK